MFGWEVMSHPTYYLELASLGKDENATKLHLNQYFADKISEILKRRVRKLMERKRYWTIYVFLHFTWKSPKKKFTFYNGSFAVLPYIFINFKNFHVFCPLHPSISNKQYIPFQSIAALSISLGKFQRIDINSSLY